MAKLDGRFDSNCKGRSAQRQSLYARFRITRASPLLGTLCLSTACLGGDLSFDRFVLAQNTGSLVLCLDSKGTRTYRNSPCSETERNSAASQNSVPSDNSNATSNFRNERNPKNEKVRMGPQYHENASDVCRLWARMSISPPPYSAAISKVVKIAPTKDLANLAVTASANLGTRSSSCDCLFEPGDSDLKPAVRLIQKPLCVSQ